MSYLVQKGPNYTFIWAFSVYVVLGQLAVLAQDTNTHLVLEYLSCRHMKQYCSLCGFGTTT